jgi:hypothetical protein
MRHVCQMQALACLDVGRSCLDHTLSHTSCVDEQCCQLGVCIYRPAGTAGSGHPAAEPHAQGAFILAHGRREKASALPPPSDD